MRKEYFTDRLGSMTSSLAAASDNVPISLMIISVTFLYLPFFLFKKSSGIFAPSLCAAHFIAKQQPAVHSLGTTHEPLLSFPKQKNFHSVLLNLIPEGWGPEVGVCGEPALRS